MNENQLLTFDEAVRYVRDRGVNLSYKTLACNGGADSRYKLPQSKKFKGVYNVYDLDIFIYRYKLSKVRETRGRKKINAGQQNAN